MGSVVVHNSTTRKHGLLNENLSTKNNFSHYELQIRQAQEVPKSKWDILIDCSYLPQLGAKILL